MLDIGEPTVTPMALTAGIELSLVGRQPSHRAAADSVTHLINHDLSTTVSGKHLHL